MALIIAASVNRLPHSTREQILSDAAVRASVLLKAVNRDTESLRASSDAAHAEGAALCDDVAAATRRFITELELELDRRETPTP